MRICSNQADPSKSQMGQTRQQPISLINKNPLCFTPLQQKQWEAVHWCYCGHHLHIQTVNAWKYINIFRDGTVASITRFYIIQRDCLLFCQWEFATKLFLKGSRLTLSPHIAWVFYKWLGFLECSALLIPKWFW